MCHAWSCWVDGTENVIWCMYIYFACIHIGICVPRNAYMSEYPYWGVYTCILWFHLSLTPLSCSCHSWHGFCLQCACVWSLKEEDKCKESVVSISSRSLVLHVNTELMLHNRMTMEIRSVWPKDMNYINVFAVYVECLIMYLKAFYGVNSGAIAIRALKLSFIKISFNWRATL